MSRAAAAAARSIGFLLSVPFLCLLPLPTIAAAQAAREHAGAAAQAAEAAEQDAEQEAGRREREACAGEAGGPSA